MILLDTNIFIEILQNTPAGQRAVETLETAAQPEKFAYSVITWFELCARPQQTETARQLLQGFEPVVLTLPIAESAAEIFHKHMSANRRRISDALIAATARAIGASLWTLNRSDFKRVPRLELFPK